jgi:Asp-tRNA(Asn)/Glu-tRNA(Gln) amidotransferase A subunit family amidase
VNKHKGRIRMTPRTRLLASSDDLTVVSAINAVATGSRTVASIASELLKRARQVDGDVMSFRILHEEAVIDRARSLDADLRGSLAGTAVGVKDVIDTADLPTGYGSPLFANHQPSADADVVTRLRTDGAMIFGKTESTEFAMFHPAPTRNPHDLSRTPGGSSSGSAAAVAAGIVPAALGTQTAGSVVRPAAYCGIYGFKPTRGWTSTKGVWRLSQSLDTVGLFARVAADLAILYRMLRFPGTEQATRPRPSRRAAAVLSPDEWGSVEQDVEVGLETAARHLERSGWMVTQMRMPAAWRHLPELHATIMAAEVARNMRDALAERVDLISKNARSIVERGEETPAMDYLAARRGAEDALRPLPQMAEAVDLILAPSALGVAPEGLETTGDPVMCRPWTLLGLPACNVPGICRADGLPVGVQAVSPAFDDVTFLNDLAAVEAAIEEGKDHDRRSPGR